MGLVVDEYAAADNYYFFTEPLFFRYPTNTNQVFDQFVNNPDEFEEFEITPDYIGQRYHDLSNDLHNLRKKGETLDNFYKIQYYTGLVAKIQAFYYSHELGQHDVAEAYNFAQREMKRVKSHPAIGQPDASIGAYYYYKGQSDICKQILLNTPLMRRQGEE